MHPNYSIARDDWSLYRKGHMDQQRHTEKVKEAIKNNLADIVSEESIIMSEGNKIIKVPIRSLEEYRFRFNFHQGKHGGQGQGNSQKGDVLGTDPKNYKGSGRGKGAGDEPGVDYYEAEITIDELAEMIFTDLSLPNLEQRSKEELTARSIRFNDVRKTGLMGNIDRKRTILANLKRNAEAGKQGIFGINTDDLRFRTWEETNEPEANAVVLAMMDVSGSMGSFEKYVARTFFFWTVRFLRTKYERVKVIFLAHHTLAKEVTEEEFFTKGESGGTKCSSVYRLALDIINQRYSPQDYNIYPFHFSDGDNLPSDNETCVKLMRELLKISNIFGYGEIVSPFYQGSTLMNVYRRIKDPKLITVSIKEKRDVYPALQRFFSNKPEVGIKNG